MEEIKKEAERIIDLFKFEKGHGICEDTGIKGIDESQAKQCALIYLNEMIEQAESFKKIFGIKAHPIIDFLKQVKQYIIDNY